MAKRNVAGSARVYGFAVIQRAFFNYRYIERVDIRRDAYFTMSSDVILFIHDMIYTQRVIGIMKELGAWKVESSLRAATAEGRNAEKDFGRTFPCRVTTRLARNAGQ